MDGLRAGHRFSNTLKEEKVQFFLYLAKQMKKEKKKYVYFFGASCT